MSKSISIIIPVYNEEAALKACLEAIEKQTVQPDEVIIVDNNSTDKSMEIARQFSFVTLVTEKRQGRGFAYSAGFNAATGDILGRINGDSIMYPNWVERVKYRFEADPELKGLAGLGAAETPLFVDRPTTAWLRGYYWWNLLNFRVLTFWGGCMAVDRQAWLEVRDEIHTDDRLVHDDEDLAYLLTGHGLKIARDNHMRIRTRGRHYIYWPKLREYRRRQYATHELHRNKGTFNNPRALLRSPWVKLHYLWGLWIIGGFYLLSFLYSVPRMLRARRK